MQYETIIRETDRLLEEIRFLRPLAKEELARLLMNAILVKNGYPATIIPPARRREYISAVRDSNFGKLDGIRTLATEMSQESCWDYLRMFSEKRAR
jgi:hypothetical protein